MGSIKRWSIRPDLGIARLFLETMTEYPRLARTYQHDLSNPARS